MFQYFYFEFFHETTKTYTRCTVRENKEETPSVGKRSSAGEQRAMALHYFKRKYFDGKKSCQLSGIITSKDHQAGAVLLSGINLKDVLMTTLTEEVRTLQCTILYFLINKNYLNYLQLIKKSFHSVVIKAI